MFSFNFGFFSPRATEPVATKEQPSGLTPENKVISISHHADDDFVDVDLKKLSYAEVAALSRSVKISDYKTTQVIEEADLGTDVSDCQMASALAHSSAATATAESKSQSATLEKKMAAVSDALADDELLLDLLYDDKGNRFPSKQHKKKIMKKRARKSMMA